MYCATMSLGVLFGIVAKDMMAVLMQTGIALVPHDLGWLLVVYVVVVASASHSLLRDTTEGFNKQNDNPAQRKITPQAGEVHDTSAGASISARNERISTYRSDKSTLDGESYDVHTHRINLESKSYLKIVASTVWSGAYPTT